MDNKETQTIGFRVTVEELAQLDARTSERGMSRAEFVHAIVFAPDNSARIAQLEKQLHELTDRLAREAERQEARRCNNPEHANLFGVGHCFICDIPMQSSH
jgi:hypothetical protein